MARKTHMKSGKSKNRTDKTKQKRGTETKQNKILEN